MAGGFKGSAREGLQPGVPQWRAELLQEPVQLELALSFCMAPFPRKARVLTCETEGWSGVELDASEPISPPGLPWSQAVELHLELTLPPSWPCPHLWQSLAGSPAD